MNRTACFLPKRLATVNDTDTTISLLNEIAKEGYLWISPEDERYEVFVFAAEPHGSRFLCGWEWEGNL
jgi:hypothetical protein